MHLHDRADTLASLLYKAEKPSVCPSVCTFWHADISAVSAWIETGLARNEGCVFEDHKVYFYKTVVPTIHRQECCLKNEGVTSVKQLASSSSPTTVDIFHFS